jgi:hypothetical protein
MSSWSGVSCKGKTQPGFPDAGCTHTQHPEPKNKHIKEGFNKILQDTFYNVADPSWYLMSSTTYLVTKTPPSPSDFTSQV